MVGVEEGKEFRGDIDAVAALAGGFLEDAGLLQAVDGPLRSNRVYFKNFSDIGGGNGRGGKQLVDKLQRYSRGAGTLHFIAIGLP